MLRDLIANFAVIGLFVAVWALSQEWISTWSRTLRMAGAAFYMGAAAIISMALSVQLTPGVIFDLRSIAAVLAGIFAGPLAGLIAGAIAGAFRIWLGGAGMMAGLGNIVIAIALGVIVHGIRKRHGLTPWLIAALAIFQGLVPLLPLPLLPEQVRGDALSETALWVFALTVLASSLAVTSIELSRNRGRITHMLRSAIRQAPDFFYVKDRDSRFVAANQAIGTAWRAEDVIGKTDFDLTTAERAQSLYDAEQTMLSTGDALVDIEESLADEDGTVRTYVSTKRPIFNHDGSISGLVGVTKDLTERFALENKLRETQAELDMVLEVMSDGVARFDEDMRLIYANPNYRNLFPLTGSYRQLGTSLGDILDMVVATGEQSLGDLAPDAWKQMVFDRMREGGDEQVAMADGRWLLIRSAATADGGTVVIVSDITALKQSEVELIEVAEQFRVLASIDALTGLHNRRDFDRALQDAFQQARAHGLRLGVLLADIDFFKAYNDTYGHPAGDACLRQVALCINGGAKRNGDLAARYGGEEFAIILSHTTPEGLLRVAENICQAVRDLGIEHRLGLNNRVTISIGAAELEIGQYDTPEQMLRAADRALYAAKNAGRDKVMLAESED